jgi:hypothetical protein
MSVFFSPASPFKKDKNESARIGYVFMTEVYRMGADYVTKGETP